MDGRRENPNFQNECRCHGYLIVAAHKVNSVYTLSLFTWIAVIYVSIIINIYSLNYFYVDTYQTIFNIMSIAIYIFKLTCLIAVCELASYEVN